MRRFIRLAAVTAIVLAVVSCNRKKVVYENEERNVWVHPVKCLATGLEAASDSSQMKAVLDFAFANGIEDGMVDGMLLNERDSAAIKANSYAHTMGLDLLVSYDGISKQIKDKYGNEAVVASACSDSVRHLADSLKIMLWPCAEGENYGIPADAVSTVCNGLGRLVTSPVEISIFHGTPEELSRDNAFCFFKDVAVEWSDECKMKVRRGKYAVVSRKASSEGKWFTGGINGRKSRRFSLKTDFLTPGDEYEATIYTDSCGKCAVSRANVNSTSTIDVNMEPFGGFAISFKNISIKQAPICIVPQPESIVFHTDREGVVVKDGCTVSVAGDGLEELFGTFRTFCRPDSLPQMEVCPNADACISVAYDERIKPEGYRLECAGGRISISAGDTRGAWWALQTLLQILKQTKQENECAVPALSIEDAPLFAYRGAHLDCCRHFFNTDEVKTYIDIMAMHKLNTFHWHLTDDQGWRIQIMKYPELTITGAKRDASQIGQDYWQEDGVPYGPFFYTQDEARDIVAYAAERQITVIPEIEMPGHAQAAIASYPWLKCQKSGHMFVRLLWGSTSDGAVCPSKESTYEFYHDVLDEICDIFPGEYIHIGGDEVDFKSWKQCPDCQRAMKEFGFEKEVELHGRMVKLMEEYLKNKGRKTIGWDEILDGGVSRTAVIMSWRGMEGGVSAAKMGNDAVLCPARWAYFDGTQSIHDPVYGLIPEDYRGMLTLRTAYSFAPLKGLSEKEASHIKGIQANVWTEYIKDFNGVQWMLIPRISATSEVAWSKEKTEYDWFSERLQRALFPLYDSRNYNYCNERP